VASGTQDRGFEPGRRSACSYPTGDIEMSHTLVGVECRQVEITATGRSPFSRVLLCLCMCVCMSLGVFMCVYVYV
jgi:hypothetical protein